MDKNANSWTGRFNFCWQELFPVFLYIHVYYEFKTTGNKNVGSIGGSIVIDSSNCVL